MWRAEVVADSVNAATGDRLTYIYALLEPDDNVVRYVGKTVGSVTERVGHHYTEARSGHVSHKCHWLRQLLAAGRMARWVVLDVAGSDWAEREREWIAFYRALFGDLLTNLADGGGGSLGYKLSPEQRRRQSRALRKPKPPGFGEKIGNYWRGRSLSAEHRAKVSAARLGTHLSPEHRAKLSASQSGIPSRTEESRSEGPNQRGGAPPSGEPTSSRIASMRLPAID